MSAESRFALALRGNDCGFWEFDLASGEVQWWNDWCATVDIDPCTGPDHSARWRSGIHPEDLPQFGAGLQAVIGGDREGYELEFRMRTRQGGWRWLASRGRATRRDAAGRAQVITGITMDIDSRKRAELALRESESRLEAAVWGTEIGLWESDFLGTFHWFNDWCGPLGIDPCDGQDQQARWNARIHPDDLAEYTRELADSFHGNDDHYVIEYRIRTLDGRWRWLHERGRVTARHADSRASRVVGVCIDIDARKQMEAALRHAEARYQLAINAARLPVWDWDLVTDVVRGNVHWHHAVGYDLTEAEALLRTETGYSDVHPDDIPVLDRFWNAYSTGEEEIYESEYRMRTPAGHYKWMLTRGLIVARDALGKPLQVAGIALDIDSRKRMEIALRTQAMILETMREGVVLIGADGRIEFTNPALDDMFRHPAGALVGSAVVDLLQPRARRAKRAVQALLQRFDGRHGRRSVPFRRLDGSEFTAEVLSAPLDLHGEKKTLVVLQDISSRKVLEREITEITQREQRRLGSDLHDGLGQELTGISLMLRGLARRIGTVAAELSPDVDEVIQVVNKAIDNTRSMARGLSPIRLEGGSLIPALNQLAARLRAAHRVEVRMELAMRAVLSLDEASATHLYLIAQEAITNALKHGRAKTVVVKLRSSKNAVTLTIGDDGCGLPAAPQAGFGMGLKIMEYRAGIIGGTLRVTAPRSGGTRIRCVCPQLSRPRARTPSSSRVAFRR